MLYVFFVLVSSKFISFVSGNLSVSGISIRLLLTGLNSTVPLDKMCKTPNPKFNETLLFLFTTTSTISSRTLDKMLLTASTLRPLDSDNSLPLMLINFSSSISYGSCAMLASFSTSLKTAFGPGQYIYRPCILANVPKYKVSTIASLSIYAFTFLHMLCQSLTAMSSCCARYCFC